MSKRRPSLFQIIEKRQKDETNQQGSLQKKRGLNIEPLEDRCMLAADIMGQGAFDDLEIDASQFHPSRIIVQFAENREVPANFSVAGNDFSVGSRMGGNSSLRQVNVPNGMDVTAAITQLNSRNDVVFAELDYRVSLTATPNDPSYSSLWGLNNTGQTGGTFDADIDALEAWEITTGSASTIVAVIDTGVDYNHVDLADNMWVNTGEIAGNGFDDDGNGFVDDIYGYDFADNDGNPIPDSFTNEKHGTHVAGTIGAVGNNGTGVVGVNWDVQIMSLRFLDESGSGYTSDAVDAVYYAVDNGATISNNSWGGGGFSQAMYDAIAYGQSQGHIFIAAAGNSGTNNDSGPHYPSNYDLANVVSVASTDHNDQLSSFSNYGANTVDLAAPGSSIYSTFPGNAYGTYSGTSMATPHVAGAVALVVSEYPDLNYQEVLDRVYDSVDTLGALSGKMVTGGRLNAAAALANSFGVSVSPTSGLQTSEAGGTASFEVVLTSAPTENVVIPMSSSDESEGTVADSSITFTPSNWDVPQTIVISGEDDQDIDGNVDYEISLANTLSNDANYNNLNVADVSVTNVDNEVSPVDFHFSVTTNGTSIGGLVVDNEDIIAKMSNGTYEFAFDGSDMGLAGLTIDAFMVTGPDTILMSFSGSAGINGLGTVDDSDIIQFTGTFGSDTSGTLSWFFDGSDVGLTRNGEDVDALTILQDGSLLVSTSGGYSVTGASGADEDLIRFTGSFGSTTTGTWEIYFDGSDVGLNTSSSEDVDAVAVDNNGNILLSTRGNFSVSGVSGADEDVFVFVPSTLGSNTSGSFQSQLFFDGSSAGLGGTDIFGFDVPTESNESPTAVGDSYAAFDEDTTLNVDGSAQYPSVLANDSDPEGDSLTAVLVDGAAHGTLDLNADGTFSYVPDENYNGSDSFSYKASDGTSFSNVVTVSLSITPVNDAPVAVDDGPYSVDAGETLTVNAANGVLTNDGDVDGDVIKAALVSNASNGTLNLNSDGSFVYSPNAGFDGTDSFIYAANDGALDSNQITVNIEVLPQNDPPVAVGDTYAAFDEDTTLNVDGSSLPGVLANDNDPEGESLSAVLVDDVSNGTLSLNDDGTFTYTPDENYNGSDSFTYKASDGVNFSNIVSVNLTITPVNDAPEALADNPYSVDANQTLTVNAANGVLTNDSDVDGDNITAVLVSGTTNGSLTLNNDGSFVYSPDVDFSGSDSFTYAANDTLLNSNQITVTIEVVGDSGTKFFVVDSRSDSTYEYAADGSFVENYNLASGSAKGVTTTADGSTVWVIDNNDYIYVYDDSGNLLGDWYAVGLDRPEGIALDGDDLLIVDRGMDAVLRFTGAAAWRSGSTAYDSGFYLAASNSRPYGITTDGSSFWVVDDQRSFDSVYKYSLLDGNYYWDGNWTIDSGNSRPRGITIDPNDVNHLWIVDSRADDIFEYQNSVNRVAGSFTADQRYELAGGNGTSQGIADPNSLLGGSSLDIMVGINTHAGSSQTAGAPMNTLIASRSFDTLSMNPAIQDVSRIAIEPISKRISALRPSGSGSESSLLEATDQEFDYGLPSWIGNDDLTHRVRAEDHEETLLDNVYGNLDALAQATGKLGPEWFESQN